MNSKLTIVTIVFFASLIARGEQSPLDLIISETSKHPSELSLTEITDFVKVAKQERNRNNYATRSETTLFLLDAGDSETIKEVLTTARNYERYGDARRAWNLIDKSTNPDLISSIHDALRDDGLAVPEVYADEFFDLPSSTRAALAAFTIIINSRAFSADVTKWAAQKLLLAKKNYDFEAVRESARAFTAQNITALKEKRYSDAGIPPEDTGSEPSTFGSIPDDNGGLSNSTLIDGKTLPVQDKNFPETQADNSQLSPLIWAAALALVIIAITVATRIIRTKRLSRRDR